MVRGAYNTLVGNAERQRDHLVDLGVDRASLLCILNWVWRRALMYLAWQTIVVAVERGEQPFGDKTRLNAATFIQCGLC